MITYTSVTPDDILDAGVDATFIFTADDFGGTETNFVAKGGATTYFSGDYPVGGVIGSSYGLGRVISFSTLMGPLELGDPNYSQLLANAVTWSTTSVSATAGNTVVATVAAGGFRRGVAITQF